jgi:hypothetical protein
MTHANTFTIPGLPNPLRWQGEPQHWELADDGTLMVTAGRLTDWFVNPDTGEAFDNAPAALMPVDGPCMLRALVMAEHAATYDAGVLTVYHAPDVWGKICIELSPQGQVMIVSVVTRGTSDDCNSMIIDGHSAYLRLAKLDRAYAFHYSADGRYWHMIRHFSLGDTLEAQIGFLAQSPRGESCTASFSEIAYVPEKLEDIRSGV